MCSLDKSDYITIITLFRMIDVVPHCAGRARSLDTSEFDDTPPTHPRLPIGGNRRFDRRDMKFLTGMPIDTVEAGSAAASQIENAVGSGSWEDT